MSKKLKKEFEIWFEQVNQTKYNVKAVSEEEALKKATKLWKEENGRPVFGEIWSS